MHIDEMLAMAAQLWLKVGKLTLGAGMEFGTVPCSVVWLYVFFKSENPAGDERGVGPRGRTGPLPYPAPALASGGGSPAEV